MKQLLAAVIGVLFLAFVLLINLYIISFTQPRILPFNQEVIRIETKGEEVNQILLWTKLAQGSHGNGNYITSDPKSVSLAYLKNCWEDTNYLRLFMDYYCVLLWMLSLDQQTVVSIHGVTPFQKQVEVGMDCKFDGVAGYFGIQGEWRTCIIHNQKGETISSFANEIVAFHIDKILGFHRSLPSVPRLFSASQIERLSSRSNEPDARKNLENVMHNCGANNYIDGSMTGTLPKQFSLLPANQEYELFYFMDLSSEEIEYHKLKTFNIGERSRTHAKRVALEIISLNIFALIMDYYPDINTLHIISNGKENGPVIYPRLTESKCESKDLGRVEDHPLTKFCKYPKRIAERLLYLKKISTLGDIVSSSTKSYQNFPSQPFLKESCREHLDLVTKFLIASIEMCVEKNGFENVIITDAWSEKFDYMAIVTNLFGSLN